MSKINHEKLNKDKNVEKSSLPAIKLSSTTSGGLKLQVTGKVDSKKFLVMLEKYFNKNYIEEINWPTIYFTP